MTDCVCRLELTLGELLADPLIRLVSASDGLSAIDLEQALARAREALSPRQPASSSESQ
jgi:hypothetical protein